MNSYQIKTVGWLVLATGIVAAVLLSRPDRTGGTLEEIRRTGELVVLTRYGSTTFYESRDGLDGYEYALTQEFAESLGVKVRYEILDSIPEVLEAIASGRGHLAAAALTRTEEREQAHVFGPDYKTVQQQVVCHRKGTVPKSIAELSSVRLLVIGGSSYVERLRELKVDVPDLEWGTTVELSTDEILEQVSRQEVDCAVSDSNIVAINQRYFPDLQIAFPISEEQSLAWVIPPGADELLGRLEKFFAEADENGLLAGLDERYFGHVTLFDYVDTKRYMRRIRTRLPQYRDSFERAAEKHNIPWTLLAAASYQESHWNPRARSPTGVRGMMMLTLPTARAMGVKNRLDPGQSIMGGARYLARMIERIPESVQGEDRLWFALAAYNVGFGHLQDARELAARLGQDPNRWHSLKTVFPLLSRKKYYRTVKHGYARGSEPVEYVERIRSYLDMLERALPIYGPVPGASASAAPDASESVPDVRRTRL
ncbi:MAG TPA: membrane-bound lytic murein transglycosylase MltF [Gammaproteobacteria bacterium]|nr:membrane-bound lytic murein transglycosylase MltF [Gammaproteobacteria bacterium]